MEDSLHEMTDEEISTYAELQVCLELDGEGSKSSIIGENLEILSRFGKDVKEIDANIRGILDGNIILREKYQEAMSECGDFWVNLELDPRGFAEAIGHRNPEEAMKGSEAMKAKRGLERQLRIETSHLGNFGKNLVDYIGARALAGYRSEEFTPQPEFESYIKGSDVCRQIQNLYIKAMRHFDESGGPAGRIKDS